MTPRVIGHRQFTDGVTRPVYEDDRGQFIVEDGERVDGLLPGQVAQFAFGNQQPIAGPFYRAVDGDEYHQAAVPEIRLNDRPPTGETPVPEIRGKGCLAADERRVVLHRDIVPAKPGGMNHTYRTNLSIPLCTFASETGRTEQKTEENF